MTNRVPVTEVEPLRPLAPASNGWRDQLRDAFAHAGHKHESIANALGVARTIVTRFFDRTERGRMLNIEHLERLRDSSCTREAWMFFVQQHALSGGLVFSSAQADALTHGARAALLTRELTDVLRCYADVMAAGDPSSIDAAKLAELERELGEASDAITAGRVAVRAALLAMRAKTG